MLNEHRSLIQRKVADYKAKYMEAPNTVIIPKLIAEDCEPTIFEGMDVILDATITNQIESSIRVLNVERKPPADYMKEFTSRIMRENFQQTDLMLRKLLVAMLRGETLVLVQQQSMGGTTIKYQYQWQKITLPEKPLTCPSCDEGLEVDIH